MNDTSLGRLERVGLQEAWTSESRDFTPWLARPENLSVLGDALGLELETVAEEKSVGRFRADILCRDIDNHWVLIENQLERTDHTHLGQLLTYAAGLEAETVIWVAASFTDEHRAALHWLNGITDERFRFFGLEIELWRIGDSPVAPKFNVVSQPNDWSKSVGKLSKTQVKQREYWRAFHEVLDAVKGSVRGGDRIPQPHAWMAYYTVKHRDFYLSTVMVPTQKRVRVELRIKGTDAKAFFGLLRDHKDEIEGDFGYPLEWKGLPKQEVRRIVHNLENVDPMDEAEWPRQHKWLADSLNAMHRVFYDRVQNLDPADWRDDEDE